MSESDREMSGSVIRLNRRWELASQLGKGGYGRVFAATADDGAPAAVKLVPKEPGAARELLFADLDGVRNVVPVVDSGGWRRTRRRGRTAADRVRQQGSSSHRLDGRS